MAKVHLIPKDPRDLPKSLKWVDLRTYNGKNVHVALANKAYGLLGYRKMLDQMDIPGPLGRKLIRANIQVLSKVSVANYKAEMLKFFNDKKITASYSATVLRAYTADIPEFVLEKAVKVARADPKATFFVDEPGGSLINGNHGPLLFVQDERAEKYYLEVWDVPKLGIVKTDVEQRRRIRFAE